MKQNNSDTVDGIATPTRAVLSFGLVLGFAILLGFRFHSEQARIPHSTIIFAILRYSRATMGNLVWHTYARLISITASAYAIWASFFGLFYRKFFWDFVGGTLRDPGGIQAPPRAAPFIAVIVKVPIVQTVAMLLGIVMLVLEYPLPQIKQFAIYRSLVLRIVLLLFQVFINILYYQGTNAALWSLIAAVCYARAIALGEVMKEAEENRGKAGAA